MSGEAVVEESLAPDCQSPPGGVLVDLRHVVLMSGQSVGRVVVSVSSEPSLVGVLSVMPRLVACRWSCRCSVGGASSDGVSATLSTRSVCSAVWSGNGQPVVVGAVSSIGHLGIRGCQVGVVLLYRFGDLSVVVWMLSSVFGYPNRRPFAASD